MNRTQIRPRCTLSSTLSPDEVFLKLKEKVREKDSPVIGNISNDYALFRVPVEIKRFWNPELQVSAEKQGSFTAVKGMIGPKPKVWTSFVFGYGIAIMLSIFGGMYGYSQYALGNPAPWLWSFPVAAVFAIMVFITAKIGQYLAQDQMRILRDFLDTVIEEAEKS
jgi:hypothetical protein